MTSRVVLVLFLILGCAAPLRAQTPQGTGFSYQGSLRQGGSPVEGSVDMVFDLFDAQSGGNAVGPSLAFTAANGNPVAVAGGVFNVTLDFGSTAFNGPTTFQRWLRITVAGTPLAPRARIDNAPYTLQARTAEIAYDVPPGTIGAAEIKPAEVQRRVTGSCASGSSMRTVAQDGSVTCQVDANSGGTITGITAGTGLAGGGSSGTVGVAADTTYLQRRVGSGCAAGSSIRSINSDGTVACQSDENSGGTITGVTAGSGLAGGGAAGSVQLGIANPLVLSSAGSGTRLRVENAGAAVTAIDTVATGAFATALSANAIVENPASGSGTGVLGRTNGESGAGVYGWHTAATGLGYGVWGQTSSTNGYAIAGVATATACPDPNVACDLTARGVVGESRAVLGKGVYGTVTSSTAVGVEGVGPGNGVVGRSTGSATGVVGTSTSGDGVRGGAVGGAAGVRGTTTGSTGFGVVGYASAATGSGRGVYGQSDSAGGQGVHGYSGSGAGVLGTTGSDGWAGAFVGRTSINGPLSKPLGSFEIDHPLDPANKLLYHSFVESPDMKNIYDGVVRLDARGEAWVELPDYFEALNRDFRYQLTALDAPAPSLHVSRRIADRRFQLAGGAPGQEVSWQVTGTRHDAYAEAHRIEVVVEKTGADRGRYLYPIEAGKSSIEALRPWMRGPASALEAASSGGP